MEKELYPNQKDVLEKFLKYIKPLFNEKPEIKEAYLWGTLASERFGVYKKIQKGEKESDVDLVIFLKPNSEIPKDWKNLNDPHSWFNVYKDKKYRNFKYQNHIHKVDLIVANKDKTIKDLERTNNKIKSKFFKIFKK